MIVISDGGEWEERCNGDEDVVEVYIDSEDEDAEDNIDGNHE